MELIMNRHHLGKFAVSSLYIAALTLPLIGCNDDDNTTPQSTTQKGTLIGEGFEFIAFESDSYSGTLDEQGQFQFEPGDTVSFHIGDHSTPKVLAKENMTLFDIFDAPILTTFDDIADALEEDNKYSHFEQMTNFISVLVLLDENFDLSDGIQLRDIDVVAFTRDFSLEFDFVDFEDHMIKPRLREQGYDIDYPLEYSLAQYYALEGISVPVFMVSEQTETNTSNGSSSVYTKRYDYFDNGLLKSRLSLQDDSFRETFDYEYNTLLRKTSQQEFSYSNNVKTYEANFEYQINALGNRTLTTVLHQYGDEPVQESTSTYQRTEKGLTTYYEQKYSVDNVLESLSATTTSYSEDGLIQTRVIKFDSDPSTPEFDESTNIITTYDDNRNALQRVFESDTDNDGVINHLEEDVYTYNSIGQVLTSSFSYDTDNDSTIDGQRNSNFTYDDNFNLIEETEFYTSNNSQESYKLTATYNQQGLLERIEVQRDSDNDGEVNDVYTDSFEYDADGNEISSTTQQDTPVGGDIENASTSTYDYDQQGNQILATYSYYNNGTCVNIASEASTYDENNNLLEHSIEYDYDCNQTIDNTSLTTLKYVLLENAILAPLEEAFDD